MLHHAFWKHSYSPLSLSLLQKQQQEHSSSINPMPTTPTSSSLSAEVSGVLKNIETEISNVVSEFVFTPKSSVNAITSEIEKLETYVVSTNKSTAQNNLKINQIQSEASTKVGALNAENASNQVLVSQAQELIIQLTAIVNPPVIPPSGSISGII